MSFKHAKPKAWYDRMYQPGLPYPHFSPVSVRQIPCWDPLYSEEDFELEFEEQLREAREDFEERLLQLQSEVNYLEERIEELQAERRG